MAATANGKTGVKALWKHFWNRQLSIKWLLVCLLFFPVLQLTANFVTRTLMVVLIHFWHIPLWFFPGEEYSQVNFWDGLYM
jgi:hypothetical protein